MYIKLFFEQGVPGPKGEPGETPGEVRMMMDSFDVLYV